MRNPDLRIFLLKYRVFILRDLFIIIWIFLEYNILFFFKELISPPLDIGRHYSKDMVLWYGKHGKDNNIWFWKLKVQFRKFLLIAESFLNLYRNFCFCLLSAQCYSSRSLFKTLLVFWVSLFFWLSVYL